VLPSFFQWRNLRIHVCVFSSPKYDVNVGSLWNVQTNKKQWASLFCVSTLPLVSDFQSTSDKSFSPWLRCMLIAYWFIKYIRSSIHWWSSWKHHLQTMDLDRQVWISNHYKVNWRFRWIIAWKTVYFSFITHSLQHGKLCSSENWSVEFCLLGYHAG
jgi:hypothetical protein